MRLYRNYYLSKPLLVQDIFDNTNLQLLVNARVIEGVVYEDEDWWLFDGENIGLLQPYNVSLGVYDRDRVNIISFYDENVAYKILNILASSFGVDVMDDQMNDKIALNLSKRIIVDKDSAFAESMNKLGLGYLKNPDVDLQEVQVWWGEGIEPTVESVTAEDDMYYYLDPRINNNYYTKIENVM